MAARTITPEAERALGAAKHMTLEMRKLAEREEELGRERRRLLFIANRGGVIYDEIAEVIGIDRSRVAVEIGRAKEEGAEVA